MQTEGWLEPDWVKSETLFPKKEEKGGKEEREMKMEEGKEKEEGERELILLGTYLFILKK